MRKQLTTLEDRIASGLESIPNESTTITSLVHPFVNALGYSPSDPSEFISECVSDFTRRGDTADCAILRNGSPIILFECKCWRVNLSHDHVAQLRKYFSVHPSVKLGILTNGVEYRFFTDSENKNMMDAEPFLSFDLSNPSSVPYNALSLFSKSTYTPAVLSRLHVVQRVKKDMQSELSKPQGELARFIFSSVDLSAPEFSSVANASCSMPDQVLSIVRHILSGISSPERVVIHCIRGCWCSIAIDELGNILEFNFNEKSGKKWLASNILNGFKVPVSSLDDIALHADHIREAAKKVLKK